LFINVTFAPISQPLGTIPNGKLIGYIAPAIIGAAIATTAVYYRKKK
jgi:glycerol uptake facilitator-like aquaporin